MCTYDDWEKNHSNTVLEFTLKGYVSIPEKQNKNT